jgi:hypothetical protein
MLAVLRFLGFVGLNGGLVGAACFVLWRWLPFLASEPAGLLLWPMTVISLIIFAGFYSVLKRCSSVLSRGVVLYLAFLGSLVLYGGYLWWRVPGGSAMMIPLVLWAGHLYGIPFLVVIWVVNTAVAPILFGKPQGVEAQQARAGRCRRV